MVWITKDGRKQQTLNHLNECADYAYHIGKKFSAAELCKITSQYHDIGKFSNEFLEYLKKSHEAELSNKKFDGIGTVIHSTQGAKFLYDLYPETKSLITALAKEIPAMCIANHHGGLMDGISPDGSTPFTERLEQENAKLHYDEIITTAKNECVFIEDVKKSFEQCENELTVFLEKCTENKLDKAFMLHLLVKSIFSSLVDADRYNAYCFETNKPFKLNDELPAWEDYLGRLEQKNAAFTADTEIDMIRREISEKCLNAAARPKGIYRLDVPTGGGKTLSSLRFALNHAKKHGFDRVIYVIPYLSVLDQTAKDIKEALQFNEGDDFILEHHSNFTFSDNSDEAQSHRLFTERWDSPIILTTMVQFLESIYSNKSGDLRKFHNMSNAVFIFDEVQALPVKCINLFNEAINYLHYCAGCTVLLCTATQPPFDETSNPILLSENSSLIPDMSGQFQKLKRTKIKDCTKRNGYSTDELREFILDKYIKEGNCLVVVNTKKDALKLYNNLKNHIAKNPLENIELIHLSTSMCPAHRLEIIEAIKKREQKNVLCISTQLIEAGVNISFGCVVRVIAGLDSIAQAAGRCNRNGEYPGQKNVYIVNISDENISMLREIKEGAEKTEYILHNLPKDIAEPDLLSPDIMKEYYQKYFDGQIKQMNYLICKSGHLHDFLSSNEKGRGAFTNKFGGKKTPALCQAFQKAGELFSVIEDRTVSVVVPYGKGAELILEYKRAEIKEKYALLRKMGRFTVSLYQNQIDGLRGEDTITELADGIMVLNEGYYNDKTGIEL